MQVWTRIALVLQLIQLFVAGQENEELGTNPSMEEFIKEVENTENILDSIDFSSPNLTSIDDIDITDIASKITDTLKSNADSNSVEDIMNSAIENIMNNIAESNNAQTTQMPTESTVEAFYGEWQTWSKCTVTCGNGTRTRTRMCFREEELILDITKCEKEDDLAQQGFKEMGECNVQECVIETTVNPEDLVTIPDPDSFMDNDEVFATEVYDSTDFSEHDQTGDGETTNVIETVNADEIEKFILEVEDSTEVGSTDVVEEFLEDVVEEAVEEVAEESVEESVEEVVEEVVEDSSPSNKTTESIEAADSPNSAETNDLTNNLNETNELTALPPSANNSDTNTTTLLITVKEVSVDGDVIENTEDEMCDGKRCGCHKSTCWSYCTKLNFLWCWLDDPVEEGKNKKTCENDNECGPNWRCSSLCGL